MHRYVGELQLLQPPVDRTLRRSSAWANMIEGVGSPPDGWALATDATEPQDMRDE
jgi:hypothetical protein